MSEIDEQLKAISAHDIGVNVRQMRLARKWTQGQLGVRCGLHLTFLSRLECGRQKPIPQTLKSIAYALGVRVTELLARKL